MNDGKRCSGSIPYGYNRLPEDKQTLVVDSVASQVVKHIFELASKSLTPPAIARQLTEEKVLIPSAYTLQYHPEQCNRKAEQEAVEKAKRKKNRQRESNAAHRVKTKVERWAANDGHKYPKRICEQCGKEFYQNSTRQRFCNTDCTKAHQQVEALFSRLVKQLSKKEGVTEALKVEN